ncbi:hypothetical protein HCEG_04050 [Histoplasma capsulatum var. duboisii H88]|uniref:Uncharacterized protein n=2 Tax=Ajellomyces capsulatus TaxID=5037 RepID=F0UEV5_AJEC8|nr:hypothetical protein HCEG_04050 [Histoplasma capsulatum var. duboisii H88]QSS55606.1 hypothetical protein I7I53_03529 [Histoplasma capsulatum var. duboisii H88]
MIRQLSNFITNKRAPQRAREDVEDQNRYYDIDNPVASSRPRSPLIDRQYLTPATERQLQKACLLLSRKIECLERWTEFDTCADPANANISGSRFPDLKIPSFAIPNHIASSVNNEEPHLSNENENGTSDLENKSKFDVIIDLEEKQEISHDCFVDVFEYKQASWLLADEDVGKISLPKYESKFRSLSGSGKYPFRETVTNPLAEYWEDSMFQRNKTPPYSVSSSNDMMTDIWTIEGTPTETEQIDTWLRSAILHDPINEGCHPITSSKEWNMSPHESQAEESDSLSSLLMESNEYQTETHTKQTYIIDTDLPPIWDNQDDGDLFIKPLPHSQSWNSRSTGGKTIIDENGLEKEMSADEETQRRLDLQRAVMEKMTGRRTVPAPITDRAAVALDSNTPIRAMSPTCAVIGTNGQQSDKPADANLDERAQLLWDQQTKYTLVRKLSSMALRKKKSIPKVNNVLGFSAVVETS